MALEEVFRNVDQTEILLEAFDERDGDLRGVDLIGIA